MRMTRFVRVPQVGFIGLGQMGAPMARNLLQHRKLLAFDKDAAGTGFASVCEAGAHRAVKIAEDPGTARQSGKKGNWEVFVKSPVPLMRRDFDVTHLLTPK